MPQTTESLNRRKIAEAYNGVYSPAGHRPYKVSRNKIELFTNCPRCFYLDRRYKIERPPGFPFNLNRAVDVLLKKEFDAHRVKGEAHPLMEAYKIDAIPFAHSELNTWRENFTGVQYWHEPTNLVIHGAVDDVWQSPNGELIVVDYKATSKDSEVTIDAEWQNSYKRQMEVYQWLLRKNGFKVSNTGYFVYANGRTDMEAFDAKLEFRVKIIPYEGSDNWVEQAVLDLTACLNSDVAPKPAQDCEYCGYFEQRVRAKL